MLETIRRYSNLITCCLLALSAGVLFYAFRVHPPGRTEAHRKGRFTLISPPSQTYQNGLDALKNHNEALAEQRFRSAVQEDKQNMPAWLSLAGLLQKEGRGEEAFSCYRVALAPHPEWNSVKNRFWQLTGQIDPEEALHYAQLCVSLNRTQEIETAYGYVIRAVERKSVFWPKGSEWTTVSSSEKRAYLAIALWHHSQGCPAKARPASRKAGIYGRL